MGVENIDLDWVNAQVSEYSSIYARYNELADTLKEIFRSGLSGIAPFSIVQTRPKTIASFTEKVIRRRNEFRDPIRQFTDLCGARVIAHTQSQLENVCSFIEDNFDIDWANTVHQSRLLKETEFGYRSIHYIISIIPGHFPTDTILIEIPESVVPDTQVPMKAEIQVRSMLEHAWSAFSHMHAYKGSFELPSKFKRELAGVAALLETSDSILSRIDNELQEYFATYESYMTREQIHEEINIQEIILSQNKTDYKAAYKIGKLAITLGDWDKAIDVLSLFIDTNYQPLFRDLGIALCKRHKKTPGSNEYRSGQRYLEKAIILNPRDIDAYSSLAGTWKNIDEDMAFKLYKMAFDIDPGNSYVLGNYLEYELRSHGDASIIPLLHNALEAAIKRCRKQVEAGMNIPWAYYDIGKFYLLMEKPFRSLRAYLRAINLTSAEFMVNTSLLSLIRQGQALQSTRGYDWIVNTLKLGLAAKFPEPENISELDQLKSTDKHDLEEPVVIIAGATDAKSCENVLRYRDILVENFGRFKGTIISGGTFSGVCRVVGDIQAEYPDNVHTIGYAPSEIPNGIKIDKRYSEIRENTDSGFTPNQVIHYWSDIISQGIKPSSVKLIGIGGGSISEFEVELALTLGAQVLLASGDTWSLQPKMIEWTETSENRIDIMSGKLVDLKDFIGSAD